MHKCDISGTNGLEYAFSPDQTGEGIGVLKSRLATSAAAMNALQFDCGKNIVLKTAAERLKESGYDLDAVRDEEIAAHIDWKLPGILIEKSALKSEDDYACLWDKCRITERDLAELEKALRAGEKILPVFNPGSVSQKELVDLLVRDAGIACGTECYGAENFDKLRKISPRMLPPDRNLKRMDWMERLYAFSEANKTGENPAEARPAITFTLDSNEATVLGKSPMELIRETLLGRRFVDPVSDVLRWRRQFDRCENGDYPDRRTQTMYPLYAYDNGRIATMSCYEHSLIFFLGDCLPDDRFDEIGARPVIASAK